MTRLTLHQAASIGCLLWANVIEFIAGRPCPTVTSPLQGEVTLRHPHGADNDCAPLPRDAGASLSGVAQ
jgi:hypothetical protein